MKLINKLLNRFLRRFHHKSWEWLPEYSGMSHAELVHILMISSEDFWMIVNECSEHMLSDKIEDLNEDYVMHRANCEHRQLCRFQDIGFRNILAIYHDVGRDSESFEIVHDYVKKYSKWMKAHKVHTQTMELHKKYRRSHGKGY